MELRDRQHRGVDRAHVARHDRLQRGCDLNGHHQRVDAGLGARAVRPHAGDVDVEERAAGHHRPGAHVEPADRELGPVVHAEQHVARKALEQAVGDHRLRAAQAFLGRLEDEVHRAVEVARLRQIARRAQQHRGVAVMTAGVHAALVLRAVVEAVGLVDRQRVHVGAQADRLVRAAVAKHADDTRASDAAVHLDAEALETLRDEVGGAVLLEAQFRVRVQVAPPGGEFGMEFGDAGDGIRGDGDGGIHRGTPRCCVVRRIQRSGRVPHQSAMNSATVRVMRRIDAISTRSSKPWMFSAVGP